MSNKLPH